MTTLTLQPDETAGIDNEILSTSPTTNFGTVGFLRIGDTDTSRNSAYRSLLKFDLSSIPAGSLVSSVSLTLFMDNASDTAGLGSWSAGLRRLLRNWSESQSTWNIFSTGNNWGTAGAGLDATDRAASDSAALTLTGTLSNPCTWSAAGLVSDVQGFVNGTLQNYGWLLQAPTAENHGTLRAFNRFVSSGDATPSHRPKLVIAYTPPTAAIAAAYYARLRSV